MDASDGASKAAATLADLPPLNDAPAADRTKLFRQKLRLCCVVMDFSEPRKQVREKDVKRQALLELVQFLSDGKVTWSSQVVEDLMVCVEANIIRPLGGKSRTSGAKEGGRIEGVEEDEPVLEESWPHLQLIYELLYRFVLSKEVDTKSAKEYFSKRFMLQLLNLFDSEDPRERDYLKTILHRLYGKSMALRSFIRRSINNMFFTFVYETEHFNGVVELLEILGSIINGFALPLKAEHQKFLEKALIPLHKAANVAQYHQQLAYCTTQFVEKDPSTAKPIILGLLRFWPVTQSSKEILFLNELEEIIELIQPEQFAEVMRPLFLQLGRSITSLHFQVSQRALYLWNNESLVNLVAVHRVEILPLIFGSLYHNCDKHWNTTVQSLTFNVLKLLMEMDSQLFDQCSAQLDEREGKQQHTFEERRRKWRQLEAAASVQ
ncbi:hypothetical protein H310_12021 [Aphanomyces invadans]|uniref:Serine/threonine protein phosphatase 2A regulatory subunit n=1 Tax=Aphanomyces invadans TaxID=157072 RepID=A0A024TK65_9STRA|nr:hypothetical protein H310_12021 [Aphanomyces invadans]ETV94384.1 hypothetical protein H310_12021 [Aphanomyces invadans]|eukprot:XP_008877146.1 hypothetical protein H310_12021 [Aphanomyces invadans]